MAVTAPVSLVKNADFRGLGVFSFGNKIYLIYQSKNGAHNRYFLAESDDGLNFSLVSKKGSLIQGGRVLNLNDTSKYIYSSVERELLFTFQNKEGDTCVTELAKIVSLEAWEVTAKLVGLACPAVVLPETKSNGEYVAYCGEEEIKIGFSNNLIHWQIQNEAILSPRPDGFDSGPLYLHTAFPTRHGILILYHSLVDQLPIIGAAIADRSDPDVILWRSNDPLWKPIPQWREKKLHLIGTVERNSRIISYWQVAGEGIYAVVYLLHENDISVQSKNISLSLDKPVQNPLIAPKSENPWEAFTTFNPAAIDLDGKVHILYRAQGHDYTSVVGYAMSEDGVIIKERHEKPCFVPRENFEVGSGPPVADFVSGGGYGGCEDPRITRIGDRVYMTYVAFNGYSEPRIALTSISVEDFTNHRWFWEKPILISPPGIIDKSAVIFSEKIGGKYCILHRVFPDILMDFVDDLEFDGTTWLSGQYRIPARPDYWDSRKIGAGAPPLLTDDGWLLIYYAVDERDDRRYKIGAMLLDRTDPRIVLHRTNNPILEPNERYENEGFKSGVAYPCGAVIRSNTLFVYYGAADTYVCVATANLTDFLTNLKQENLAKLEPALIKKIL